MLAFLLTICLAFAYNPYVRSLRRPRQFPGFGQQYYGGEFDYGDWMESFGAWAPMVSGLFSGMNGGSNSATGQSSSGFQPFRQMVGPYMNNPWRMNAQKCMDNDACTSWAASQMYQGMSGSGSASSGAGANTGAGSSSDSTGGSGSDSTGGSGSGEVSDSQSGSGSGSSGSAGGFYSPAMVGFPAGFNPARYGLDWDALPKDCMDDSKCAQGLLMYTHGQNMGGSLAGLFSQFYSSRLQRPRRLSRPRYGVPFRYGRQY